MNTASVQQASGSPGEGSRPSAGEPAKPSAQELREAANAKIISQSSLFDAGWYMATYPDVAGSGLTPALHYIRIGGAERRAPSLAFDAADYVSRYQDVARTGMNPLLHYVIFGQRESRVKKAFDPLKADVQEAGGSSVPVKPAPPAGEAPAKQARKPAAPPVADKAAAREAEHLQLLAESGLFDAAWYQKRYMAEADTGLSPALHFLRHGGAKGNAPSAAFHGADYLARYKDVRESALNPLVHYLCFGKAEGRVATPFDVDAVLAALVTESGLYDESWYLATYPEVMKSKLSPLRHYLKHGREKGHHPGPGFDAVAYLAANPDVAADKINPLVHYLKSGKAEGRAIRKVSGAQKRAAPKSRKHTVKAVESVPPPAPASAPAPVTAPPDITPSDIALLQSTPLFDKAWYVSRYPEAGKPGTNPVEHYLRHGEMHQPSIFFDPQYYVIEQSPEIQHTGMNPLLHFLKVGKALGRKPRALFAENPPSGAIKPLSPSAWPLVSPPAPAEPAIAWASHAELAQKPHPASLFIGGTLVACSPDAPVLAAARSALSVFMEISGLDPNSNLRLEDAQTGFEAGYDSHAYRGLGKALTTGAAAIADAWFTTDRTLRVRFGDREEASHRPLAVRAFHAGTAATPAAVLAGEGLIGTGGPSFVDLALASPFSPLLIVVSETGGKAIEIGLLPFPSLCRGGPHHAEVAGAAGQSDPAAQMRRLSDHYVRRYMAGKSAGKRLLASISVTVSHASGTEAIFSPDMLGWIASVFGIPVAHSEKAGTATPGEAFLQASLAAAVQPASDRVTPTGNFTIELPPDAIPTIAALTARESDAGPGDVITGSWYVAEALTGRTRFSVAMPAAGEDLLRLQPTWAVQGIPVLRRVTPQSPQSQSQPGQGLHLAIRHAPPREATRAAMLMPLAPDSNSTILAAAAPTEPVDVILRATSLELCETFLKSLLCQTGVQPGSIRIECQAGGPDTSAIQSLADGLLPGKATAVAVCGYRPLTSSTLIPDSASAFTLVADDAVVLHDTRTLEALATLAAAGKTASASCVLLREAPARKGTALSFESGGYFPAHISLLSSPRLMLTLPDCRGVLPEMTYPVIANDPALIMLNNQALRAIGTGIEDEEEAHVPDSISFSLRALAAGYSHLCTSAVRATAIGMPSRQTVSDPPGLSCFGAERWENILGAIAILREIH